MIDRSFIFLPGIGYAKEKRLWEEGITTWDDFLESDSPKGISPAKKPAYDEELEKAKFYLGIRSPVYFRNTLSSRDQWRFYPTFPHRVLFLDIETTGLSRNYSKITTVSIYDGTECTTLVRGQDLTAENLKAELEGCKMLVTFYGSAFDVPFILHEFPELSFDIPHFDLCFAGRRVGLTGGLKNIEPLVGIERDEDLEEVDGFEAVRLWRKWERNGDEDALEKLIEYNQADTVNLKVVADVIYERLEKSTLKG